LPAKILFFSWSLLTGIVITSVIVPPNSPMHQQSIRIGSVDFLHYRGDWQLHFPFPISARQASSHEWKLHLPYTFHSLDLPSISHPYDGDRLKGSASIFAPFTCLSAPITMVTRPLASVST
jgi:hypothetical protein